MKTFKIFRLSSGPLVAIKQGWSWPGFFFGPLWALTKGLWGITLLSAVIFIGTVVLEGSFVANASDTATATAGILIFNQLLAFGIAITFGVLGNRWREAKLLARGCKLTAVRNAANEKAVIALFEDETGHSSKGLGGGALHPG